MSLLYRKVDFFLSANADGEVHEGDCILLEVARAPLEGELALVKRRGAEVLCRWRGNRGDDVLGVVIGIKRRL
jgi:hypothetical protein